MAMQPPTRSRLLMSLSLTTAAALGCGETLRGESSCQVNYESYLHISHAFSSLSASKCVLLSRAVPDLLVPYCGVVAEVWAPNHYFG
jgi:hypothetical protein